ncbi:MAG: hypothetical protein AB7N76_28520 [Planctomycetota bacterium]
MLAAVEGALQREQGARQPLEAITMAGGGEPTLHPDFARIVPGLAALRDRYAPAARLCLLSNGAGLRRPGVRGSLALIDRPMFELDAGDEALCQAIGRPRSLRLDDLLDELLSVPNLILQSSFVTGLADNTTREAIQSWFERVLLLEPREVHLTTVGRGSQTPGALPVSSACLNVIASALRARGVEARAFPCRDAEALAPGDASQRPSLQGEQVLSWLVRCPHHHERAHIELTQANTAAPVISWCSQFPADVPAPCAWDCLPNLALVAGDPEETYDLEQPPRPSSKRLPRAE